MIVRSPYERNVETPGAGWVRKAFGNGTPRPLTELREPTVPRTLAAGTLVRRVPYICYMYVYMYARMCVYISIYIYIYIFCLYTGHS